MWNLALQPLKHISIITMSIATKLDGAVTYREGLPPIKSQEPSIRWSCEITWQTKTIISSLQQCLWPTNMVETETYFEGFLPIKSYDLLITWYSEITWQIINITSPPPKCLWQPNLAGCWHIMRSLHP